MNGHGDLNGTLFRAKTRRQLVGAIRDHLVRHMDDRMALKAEESHVMRTWLKALVSGSALGSATSTCVPIFPTTTTRLIEPPHLTPAIASTEPFPAITDRPGMRRRKSERLHAKENVGNVGIRKRAEKARRRKSRHLHVYECPLVRVKDLLDEPGTSMVGSAISAGVGVGAGTGADKDAVTGLKGEAFGSHMVSPLPGARRKEFWDRVLGWDKYQAEKAEEKKQAQLLQELQERQESLEREQRAFAATRAELDQLRLELNTRADQQRRLAAENETHRLKERELESKLKQVEDQLERSKASAVPNGSLSFSEGKQSTPATVVDTAVPSHDATKALDVNVAAASPFSFASSASTTDSKPASFSFGQVGAETGASSKPQMDLNMPSSTAFGKKDPDGTSTSVPSKPFSFGFSASPAGSNDNEKATEKATEKEKEAGKEMEKDKEGSNSNASSFFSFGGFGQKRKTSGQEESSSLKPSAPTFSFGQQATTSPAFSNPFGFSNGTNATSASTSSMPTTSSAIQAASSTIPSSTSTTSQPFSFSLPTSSNVPAAPLTGSSSSNPATTTNMTTPFSFGQPSVTSQGQSHTFSFGATATDSSGNNKPFTFSAASQQQIPTFTSTSTSTSTSTQPAATAPTSTTSTPFSFATPSFAPTTASTPFTFGATTTPNLQMNQGTTTSGFNFPNTLTTSGVGANATSSTSVPPMFSMGTTASEPRKFTKPVSRRR